MNAISLVISNTPIQQDQFGRFCLNDLHKASGNNSEHRPSKWLRNQQTIELISELSPKMGLDEQAPELAFAPVESIRGGKSPGTYAVKELVYAYAMWISAKFHIAVIRAYDALVTGQIQYGLKQLPEPKTKKALPGGLSLEQQDVIKALVKERIEHLPKNKQGGAAIKCWSAIKTKFGKGYKEVEPENFTAVVSLIGRVAIEGELLNRDQDRLLIDSDYRAKARKHFNQHLDECHEAVRAAGATPPKLPLLDDKVVDGLVASSLLLHRWLASFDPDTMKMRLTSIPADALVLNEPEFIRYLTRERGYVVVKKSEVADKLMA